MQHDKLVMMANQIAKFFETQGETRALPQIAQHIKDFWDPRMRKMIQAHVAEGGAGLDPLALAALKTLQPVAAPAS
jgi:formate dehydrogenase subunit delta